MHNTTFISPIVGYMGTGGIIGFIIGIIIGVIVGLCVFNVALNIIVNNKIGSVIGCSIGIIVIMTMGSVMVVVIENRMYVLVAVVVVVCGIIWFIIKKVIMRGCIEKYDDMFDEFAIGHLQTRYMGKSDVIAIGCSVGGASGLVMGMIGGILMFVNKN